MNPILESLYTRKSVRVFTEQPISAEAREHILLAAAHAPTAGNQQLYTILEITDPARKARLSVTCDHQPFIATAPMVLIFLADAQKWLDAYHSIGLEARKPGVGDLMLAVSDACIAAQNAVTAAWSLGIGSCYIGDVMENAEEHRSMLELPPYVFPAAMLVLGYPTPQQLARRKPERSSLAHTVHQNTYRRMDAAELAAMLAPHTGDKPLQDWLTAFCKRKYESDFARELNRSAALYLQAFEEPQPAPHR